MSKNRFVHLVYIENTLSGSLKLKKSVQAIESLKRGRRN